MECAASWSHLDRVVRGPDLGLLAALLHEGLHVLGREDLATAGLLATNGGIRVAQLAKFQFNFHRAGPSRERAASGAHAAVLGVEEPEEGLRFRVWNIEMVPLLETLPCPKCEIAT